MLTKQYYVYFGTVAKWHFSENFGVSLDGIVASNCVFSGISQQSHFLTNWNNKVVYVGVTNDLKRRVYEHKCGLIEGFTRRYNVHKLVYYEVLEEIEGAILREKQIKGGSRQKKNDLVARFNPPMERFMGSIVKRLLRCAHNDTNSH